MSDRRFVLAAAALLTVALPLALAAPMAKDKPGDKPRAAARSADADDPSKLKTETFARLAFRGIGPAGTVQVGHLFDARARAVGIVAVVASPLTAAVLDASCLERSARHRQRKAAPPRPAARHSAWHARSAPLSRWRRTLPGDRRPHELPVVG